MTAMTSILVCLFRLFLTAWDVVTFPVFTAYYQPWKYVQHNKRPKGRIVRRGDTHVVLEPAPATCALREELLSSKVDTVDKVFSFAKSKYGGRSDCLGFRPVLGEKVEGGIAKLVQADKYVWLNYDEVDSRVNDVARGLVAVGVKPKDKIVVYADTRLEYMLLTLACFRAGFTLATVYTNLGEEGVVYGLRQTQASVVVTSQELLPKLKKLLPRVTELKTVVFFESQLGEELDISLDVDLFPFAEVETMGGESNTQALMPPQPEDEAVLMYTSGSSGAPKGAIITHRQFAAAIAACVVRNVNLLGEVSILP